MELPPIATSKAAIAALGAAIAAIALAGAVGASTLDPPSSTRASTPAAAAKSAGKAADKATGKATGKAAHAVDSCGLVTPAEASAAFGGNAGDAHLVLASCLYDDGTHKLIVSLTRDHARSQFDSAKGTGSPAMVAQTVAGLGDDAYFKDGRLGVIKGSNMMLITLAPSSGPTASPALLTVARAAATRL